MTTGDATWTLDGDLCTLRFERVFPAAREVVWAALTDPDQLEKWFFRIQGSIEAGGSIVIPWDEPGLASTIVEFEPMKTIAWTWHNPGEPESIVRFELFDDGDATRFVLRHSLPIIMANEPTDTLAGWHEHVNVLADLVAGTEREWSWETWRALKDEYALATEKERVPGDKGIIELIAGLPHVHFARSFDAPLEKVWAAISTSEGLSGWFTETDIDAREGGSITMTFPGYGSFTFPVLKFEAPRTIAFQFDEDARDVVRFDLYSDGTDRTLLVLTNQVGTEEAAADHRIGWHYHLDRLPTYLAGDPDSRRDGQHASVEKLYGFVRKDSVKA